MSYKIDKLISLEGCKYMLVVPISSINFKSSKAQRHGDVATPEPIKTPQYAKYVLPQDNVLKAQALFRLNTGNFQNNKISFKGLTPNLFKNVAVTEAHPNWTKLIAREVELYVKPNELRSEFSRDYDRILHSNGYNRQMGKTQVFSAINPDITSTRILHVNQVASIAENISDFFGLNSKLARAISLGHDIGHAPFGHSGEVKLNTIMKENGLNSTFWHEKNSLRFIDDIETKLDPDGYEKNLDLTYAVRDGIVCHCGEIDENGLKPRSEYLDLRTIQKKDKVAPFTWEGCVMRVSDKIAYLGKDIEDAINNKFLHPDKKQELIKLIKENTGLEFKEVNNTVLIGHFISDLCEHSNPQDGLRFSEQTFKLMNTVKKFNYDNIYLAKDKMQDEYFDLVLKTIFSHINGMYDAKNTLAKLEEAKEMKPILVSGFRDWLVKYSNIAPEERAARKLGNHVIYDINKPNDYKLAAIEYISSLTDRNAVKLCDETVTFG